MYVWWLPQYIKLQTLPEELNILWQIIKENFGDVSIVTITNPNSRNQK